jgi:hypothetical protein
MRAPSPALAISDGQREVLMVPAKSQTAPHRQVQRAKALLLSADGGASTRIAESRLGKVRSGRGRKPAIPQSMIDEIVDPTRHCTAEGQTQLMPNEHRVRVEPMSGMLRDPHRGEALYCGDLFGQLATDVALDRAAD